MSTLRLVFTVAIWYLPGFTAAAFMARRGHNPAAWFFAAWIGGLCTAVVVVVWQAFRPEIREHVDEPRTPV